MSAIVLDRDVVHYEVLGRGRPIIFLHGWVGSWRYWIPVMQAASISYRAYALDLWGFGDTAKVAARYTLEEQESLINGFLEELGIMRIALVGHGLGAYLALRFARKHPDIVDRVMAISLPLNDGSLNARIRSLAPPALADWLLSRDPDTQPVRAEAPKTDPQAVISSVSAMSSESFTGLWGDCETPCLLVHGQNDPLVTAPVSDQLASLPEKAHSILFEESGHFPMLDEDSKFNRLLTDFLSLTSGETPRDLQLKDEWKRRVR